MPKIKQLSVHEAQKIAAGEVIERPANIVKELIENALDASATQIFITLEDAGSTLISIVDNGCGMDYEDAHLSIKQYATSKISSVNELASITTFGFRGEALASVAAVSRLTIITKQHETIDGIKLLCEQSEIIATSTVACNAGTTIQVRDLFYNVPARKKFLKKEATELRLIQSIVTAFCLENRSVHFKLVHHDRMLLNCPPADSLMQRIAQLWDEAACKQLIELTELSQKGMRICGAISGHQHARYDRSAIYLFVNKRWVKNHALTKAVIKGYLNVLPPDRYPNAVVFIEIDPATVDVNIHPRKEEVQFLNPRIVEQAVTTAIKQTLENQLSEQLKKNVVIAPNTAIHSYRVFTKQQSEQPHFHAAPSFTPQPFRHVPYGNQVPDKTVPIQKNEQQKNLIIDQIPQAVAESSYSIIGQYRQTYVLIDREDGLFLVDQHAAHERILYEQFKSRFGAVATVALLFPVIVHISSQDIALLEPHLELLASHGIIADIFGNDQLIIKATPVHAKHVDLHDFIRTFITSLQELDAADPAQYSRMLNEHVHAQMGCKAAVKAGDTLSMQQMQQLLDDLAKTDNRFTCPHGRPTSWLLSVSDIERKFKRIY